MPLLCILIFLTINLCNTITVFCGSRVLRSHAFFIISTGTMSKTQKTLQFHELELDQCILKVIVYILIVLNVFQINRNSL